MDAERPLLPGDWQLVDTSEQRPVLLLEGKNGSRMRLSKNAYALLRRIREGATFEQIAAELKQRSGQGGKAPSPADVAEAYQRCQDRIAEIESKGRDLAWPYWFRRRMLPEPLVNRMARAGSMLYRPTVALVVLSCVVASLLLWAARELRLDTAHFWPAYGLFFLSLVFHELGHASACARYGARPSDIGFTFYLLYPAFYSDVSASWKLKRWQRVVVDLGGIYFQLAVGAVYALVDAIRPWEPLRLSVVLVLGSCVFSLNPILKMDGYWVVADGLGVTNLAKQPVRLLGHVVARLRGSAPEPLPWPRAILAILGFYSALSFSFWIYFLMMLVPCLTNYVKDYVTTVIELAHALAAAPPWPDATASKSLLTSTYVLIPAVVMIFRLAQACWVRARRLVG